MVDGRSIAREQIAEIVSTSPGTVEVLGEEAIDGTSYLSLEISLPFQGLDRLPQSAFICGFFFPPLLIVLRPAPQGTKSAPACPL